MTVSAELAPHRLERAASAWPSRLEHLDRPPGFLWIHGTIPPRTPAVAIVGARRSTIAGNEIAHELARGLARRGVQVVSGMARGIDAAAHRGALAGGGTTVAVLGCGIDICYPPDHAGLRAAIIAAGSAISEFDPGEQPIPWHFPQRNRIIAALAAAVVVVEATPRSGALSTARHAADLGREILAVPGSIRSDRSAGPNQLIRDGVAPVLELEDIFRAVPGLAEEARPHASDGAVPLVDAAVGSGRLPAETQRLLDRLGADPVHPDSLGSSLGLSAAVVGARLAMLELSGQVRMVEGGRVVRTV